MDRHKILRIVILLIFIILLSRAAYLQVIEGDYYYELSEGNRISVRPINAPRGRIYDRRGEIIVSNRLTYNLYLMQNEIPPETTTEEILTELSNLSNLSESRLLSNYHTAEVDTAVDPILLARHLSKEDMVIIAENRDLLPGLVVKESSLRDYIYPDQLVHTTGYIGEINEEELISFNEEGYNYRGGDFVGKSGLEKEYEFYLNGKRGAEQVEVNSRGEKIKTIGIKNPEAGNDLILNIDFSMQSAVEKLLQENYQELRNLAAEDEDRSVPTGISAVVMDIDSGAIISSTSLPDYNLNLFARGISNSDYQELINDPLRPMIDRNTMTAVPPGSIFKLVTGAAAMEELGVRANTSFYDSNGTFYIPNWSRPFRNWNPVGEGELDFVKAIARSNNIVFYELGYELYKDYNGEKLAGYARKFGLGSRTGIDLPSEKEGLVPDDSWKRSQLNQGWYPGDSVNLSIGQGSLLTTPVQIVSLISAVAAEGVAYKPQIVKEIKNSEGEIVKSFEPEINIDLRDEIGARVFEALKQGMYDVVNKSYGTASRHFNDFPLAAAGKTGTAQTGGANHAWFGGFAPYDNPQIAVVVFIENGGSSAYSVPIAREIMEYYFGFKNRKNYHDKVYYYNRESYQENN
ncbi:penicillin-binding protein 2 [Halanaerobium saccharolyticum]|uniref:Penicillin-binding protein 2 n=1 Tax=Halanaerobium saccharolyticum TaxID=43595 RepID=A0A4R7Z6P3_9FIRM|nr:penicillin-binding protein 2 [Halanaerobium saccharolyticum]RAK09362.1 penicillin-binding protein 2 [Halanaerobium saccharolyticum]TDW06221.1 penicillin-binding protein 2 [Halanaerobium saccharolyticum]TDX61015.1 penicillin-binding protein 2 [Halanaerobium saccharolyticum]